MKLTDSDFSVAVHVKSTKAIQAASYEALLLLLMLRMALTSDLFTFA
jgi:hypothetical protein